MQSRTRQHVTMLSLVVIGCCVLACSLVLEPIYYRRVDAGADGSRDGSVLASLDVQMRLDTNSSDAVPSDNGGDALASVDDATDVGIPTDASDVSVDGMLEDSLFVDGGSPDGFVDADSGHEDALADVLPPIDVRPDVPAPVDAGMPVFRYEFRILRAADGMVREPMNLQIRDPMGGGWLRITCLNTGTTNMQPLVPGDPNEFHRCDTDTIYRRFEFNYPSGATGPMTTTILAAPICRYRMGFEARIYDLRTGVPVLIATERDGNLIQECPDPYGVHVLLDSSIRDL